MVDDPERLSAQIITNTQRLRDHERRLNDLESGLRSISKTLWGILIGVILLLVGAVVNLYLHVHPIL
jgi:hypothetical protein